MLREGYVKGLKTAQRIISKMLRESVDKVAIRQCIDSLPLEEIATHLWTPEKDAEGNVLDELVPVDTNTLYEVLESLYEESAFDTETTAKVIMDFFDCYYYYADVYDYNAYSGTDYEDDDELREEMDVIWV